MGRISAILVAAAALLGGCSGGAVSTVPGAPSPSRASDTAQPLIFVGMSVNGQGGIGEFRRAANGNVKPVRTMAHADTLVSLFGADGSNNFWALFRSGYGDATFYAVHFSPAFKVLGTVRTSELTSAAADRKGNVYGVVVDDNIVEYAAGSYGKKVLRQLTLPCCVGSPPALAVDAAGNLYASQYPSGSNSSHLNIAVWGKSASGPAPPKRLIPTGTAAPSTMQVDAMGNLYAEFAVYGVANGIWRYPKGSKTPEWLFSGLSIAGFALDGSGNVYVTVPTIGNNFAIEVFSPNGQAIATIAGTKTRLGFPTAIAVTP